MADQTSDRFNAELASFCVTAGEYLDSQIGEALDETQIPVIKFNIDHLHSLGCDCGGAYRFVTAEINIDADAPLHTQQVAVAHEVLGVYLGRTIPPDILTEIAEHIISGIDETNTKAREIHP